MSSKHTPRSEQPLFKRQLSGEAPICEQFGITSKIKESATELKIFLQNWHKLQATGIAVLNSIKNLKLDYLSRTEALKEVIYPQGLQERCDQLQNVYEKMEACLADLALLVQQFSALVELELLQKGSESTVNMSWSTAKFRQAYQDIYEAFSSELALKNVIKEEIAHCSTKDSLLYHVLSWTSELFIGNRIRLLYESLFIAAELR